MNSPRLVSCALGLWILACTTSFADSPLTSTTFHSAYHDHPSVVKAAETKYLSDDLLAVLLDDAKPIQVKFALVNALGWDFDQKQDNSSIYLNALAEEKGIKAKKYKKELAKFSSEELTILGYMMALEHYLEDENLKPTVPLLIAAVAKHRESYCANLALTLVNAQLILDDVDQWGEIWKEYERFKNDPQIKGPLNPQATQIIEDYLVLYR